MFYFRKVKREAAQALCHVTRSRRLGLCKEFMVQTASYLNPTDSNSYSQLLRSSSSLGNRVKSPSRGRHFEKDSVLWKGLHRLVKTVGKLIVKESKISVKHIILNPAHGKFNAQIW